MQLEASGQSNYGGGSLTAEDILQQMVTSFKSSTSSSTSSSATCSQVHICPYCSKTFNRSISDLQRHIRIHTGEKPYHCPHCDYQARLKDHLRGHLYRKHGIIDNARFYSSNSNRD